MPAVLLPKRYKLHTATVNSFGWYQRDDTDGRNGAQSPPAHDGTGFTSDVQSKAAAIVASRTAEASTRPLRRVVRC